LFGIVRIPGSAAEDRLLKRSIDGWHELAAKALLCLAAIHAPAALYHQLMREDGLSNRMRSERRRVS
jgi:cytochrome b561